LVDSPIAVNRLALVNVPSSYDDLVDKLVAYSEDADSF